MGVIINICIFESTFYFFCDDAKGAVVMQVKKKIHIPYDNKVLSSSILNDAANLSFKMRTVFIPNEKSSRINTRHMKSYGKKSKMY